MYPKTRVKAIAPNDGKADIHEISSVVIFPPFRGVSSDLKSSIFGPVNPITIPNMKAVRLTENYNNESNF